MAEFRYGNISVRDNGGPHKVGDIISSHCHNFDHMRLIIKGSYRCRVWSPIAEQNGTPVTGDDGTPLFKMETDRIFEAPHWCNIQAEKKHDFECVEEPGIMWCLFSIRRPGAGSKIQVLDGFETGDEDTTVVIRSSDGTEYTRKLSQYDPRLIELLGGMIDDPTVVQHWMGNQAAMR